ncbi:YciI family protein [Streptomyces sp. B1866]|uniref:YciI family protein n=1 Tax=Streptomyces sp. B1866 TaxID=3075431 RepID=UPI002891C5D6|nr:YciI family protein [Streptomyces sp. B1866]MDT3398067.1 YciI family protein [Streptomyces sp. B1866]
MLWAIHCLDAPGSAPRRTAARPAHSARFREPGARPRPVLYGPLVADDGTTAVGSLIIVEAETREEVADYVATDPFTTSGVWQHVVVHAFSPSQRSPVQLAAAPRQTVAP